METGQEPGVIAPDIQEKEPLDLRGVVEGRCHLPLGHYNSGKTPGLEKNAPADLDLHSTGSLLQGA